MTRVLTTEGALEAVKKAARARDQAQADFEAAIRAAHGIEYVSLDRIGKAAGLSRQRVHQIVKQGGGGENGDAQVSDS